MANIQKLTIAQSGLEVSENQSVVFSRESPQLKLDV